MPSIKETTQESISHLSYHWLWGLRYSLVVLPENLSKGLNTLTENSSTLETIRHKQDLINQRSLIIRLFYRLFNIKNYASDAYKLAAFDAMKEITMLPIPIPAPQTYYFSWTRLEWAIDVIYRYCFSKTKEAIRSHENDGIASVINKNPVLPSISSEKEQPASTGSEKIFSSPKRTGMFVQDKMIPCNTTLAIIGKSETQQQSPSLSEDNPTFKVSRAMLTYLETLGLNYTHVNSELTWSTVRKAYYKRAQRQGHPDTKGTHEKFIKIKNALDALKTLIFSENEDALLGQSCTWDQYMHRWLDKISRQNDRTETELYEIKADIAAMRVEIDGLKKTQIIDPAHSIPHQSDRSVRAMPIKPILNIHPTFYQSDTPHPHPSKKPRTAKVRPMESEVEKNNTSSHLPSKPFGK